SAKIERVEIINFNVLTPVISFTRPEDRIRLGIAEEVAAADKCLAQSELIISTRCSLAIDDCLRKGSIACGVGGISLQHDLGFDPGLIRMVGRIQPVVDEDELPISFRFVS